MDCNNDYDFLNKYKRLPRPSTSPYNNNSTIRYNHSPQPNFNTSYMNAQNKSNRTTFDYDEKHPQLRKQLALGKSYTPQQQQQQQHQQQQLQQQQQQQRRASMHKERLLNNMNNTYTHLAMSNSDAYFNQLPPSIQPPERKKTSTPRTKFCTICCNTYCSCYNLNWLKNTTTTSMTMSTYVDPCINNAPNWLYNQHNQPPLPPLPSPKPQPPPPPEDDLNDVHKENHERKSSLFVRTPEKINKNSCTGNKDSIKPLSPPPPPPDTPLLDELLDYSINTALDSPPRQLAKLQFTKSNCPSTNSNSGATAKRHNLYDTSLEQIKPNKKTISGRYGNNVPKEWSPELATQALSVEAEYIQSVERLPVLLIRFPDPEINRDIVTRYSDNIVKVIFLHSPARRYCTVHLKKDADVAKTIDSISKIPFGNGFLQAEVKRRTIVDPVQSNPEDIDPFTLYVGNLYNSITRNELRRYFPGSSRIDMGFAVHLKKTRYAFIRYSNVEDAVKAFKQTYNTQIGDRTVIIRFRRINPACVRNDVEAQEACLMEQDALMADAVISETTVNNGTTLNRSPDNNERVTNSANLQVNEVASKNQSKDPQMTQNKDTSQKSHNMESEQNKENGAKNPPHIDMPLKPSVMNCAVQTDPIVDLIDRQQTQLSKKSKVIRPEKHRRSSTGADKNINQLSNNQTEELQTVENGNDRQINFTTPASLQQDRNVSDIIIKSESDVNDDDLVSSSILGKRFQSVNNNEIKTEPEENDFGLLSTNDTESNTTTNSNEISMNSFSSTTTTTSRTSHSINTLDDSIVNEHLHNANDAIPCENLLGKRSIKSESTDCNDSESCSTFTSQEMQISKPPASKKRKKRNSKIKDITATKRLATTNNHATTTLDKPSNTNIICIDDDESDDGCDDDLTIITQTNTNNLEALRQRELQTRDIKQTLLLRRLDDNFPLNASSATSVSERSAFVKKLYNELRDIEGANKQPQNEWDSVEKLLWSH